MTRVVGGVARGHRLVVPGDGTRPTSDRAREAIFSSIESVRGPWQGSHVLDLYAGSGACGLEAASRGAPRVDLVESDRAAVNAIATNRDAVVGTLAQAGVQAEVHVHQAPVERWVATAGDIRYDVVFSDPPYRTDPSALQVVLDVLVERSLLYEGALVVLERSSRDPAWQWGQRFRGRWDRKYGEAHLWIAEVAG